MNLDYTEIGEAIAEKVKVLILCGPTSEKIERATKETLKNKKNNVEIYRVLNLQKAVETAKLKAKEGDIVLLSPASTSFDAFKNFEERGKKFKECVNKEYA